MGTFTQTMIQSRLRQFDKLLALIPGNGYKLVTGILLLLVTLALQYYGANPGTPETLTDLLVAIKNWLEALGTTPMIDVATAVTVIGILHKAIKTGEKKLNTK